MRIPADAVIIDSLHHDDTQSQYSILDDFFKMEPGSLLLDESEVTGYRTFILKGKQTHRYSKQDIDSDLFISNILYRNSYVIKGSCKAVVCAVGSNT